jgi:hypothetical protein
MTLYYTKVHEFSSPTLDIANIVPLGIQFTGECIGLGNLFGVYTSSPSCSKVGIRLYRDIYLNDYPKSRIQIDVNITGPGKTKKISIFT